MQILLTNNFNLLSAAPEIWLMILDFCDSRTIVYMSRVNKRFHEIVQSSHWLQLGVSLQCLSNTFEHAHNITCLQSSYACLEAFGQCCWSHVMPKHLLNPKTLISYLCWCKYLDGSHITHEMVLWTESYINIPTHCFEDVKHVKKTLKFLEMCHKSLYTQTSVQHAIKVLNHFTTQPQPAVRSLFDMSCDRLKPFVNDWWSKH